MLDKRVRLTTKLPLIPVIREKGSFLQRLDTGHINHSRTDFIFRRSKSTYNGLYIFMRFYFITISGVLFCFIVFACIFVFPIWVLFCVLGYITLFFGFAFCCFFFFRRNLKLGEKEESVRTYGNAKI